MHFTAFHCIVHCTALHYTALHCTALHCTALHYTTLHCTPLQYTPLLQYCSPMCSSVGKPAAPGRPHRLRRKYLAYTAQLRCNVLYCITLHCTVMHYVKLYGISLYCTVLNCTELYFFYCITLYCTILHYNALHCNYAIVQCCVKCSAVPAVLNPVQSSTDKSIPVNAAHVCECSLLLELCCEWSETDNGHCLGLRHL